MILLEISTFSTRKLNKTAGFLKLYYKNLQCF